MSWISDLFNLLEGKEKQLEKARQQLINELETKGIRHLLHQMDNNQPYHYLIVEKRQNGSYSSDDSFSWYAWRQSDKLYSTDDKKELVVLLKDPAYSNQKRNIYACLASICSNSDDRELFNFLMEQLNDEMDDNLKVVILSRLGTIHKDAGCNIDPIKKALREGTSDVIRAAVKALSNSSDPEVEGLLLEEFSYGNRHLQSTICYSLNSVGTKKSIPVLKEVYKRTRDWGLRGSIEHAIMKIEERG